MNQKNSIFYVCNIPHKKIVSGHETKDAAIDAMIALRKSTSDKLKVYGITYLKKSRLDPNIDDNWLPAKADCNIS